MFTTHDHNNTVAHTRSEYKGGRFSFRFEETLHRFQNMVIDKQLGGEHKYRIPEGDGPDWIKGAGGLNGKSE